MVWVVRDGGNNGGFWGFCEEGRGLEVEGFGFFVRFNYSIFIGFDLYNGVICKILKIIFLN